MTANRPAGYRVRGSLLALAAVCMAAAACGVASGSARTARADAADASVASGTARTARPDAADASGARAEPDTSVVITEERDGQLRATMHLAHGRTMVMLGPDPLLVSLGFTYGFLEPTGMPGQPMPTRYAVITAVAPGSAAEKGGLRAGDQMLAVNGRDGRNPWLFRERAPGTVYDVRVGRSGAMHDVRVVVGRGPSRAQVEWDLRRQAACMRQGYATGRRSLSGVVCALLPY